MKIFINLTIINAYKNRGNCPPFEPSTMTNHEQPTGAAQNTQLFLNIYVPEGNRGDRT